MQVEYPDESICMFTMCSVKLNYLMDLYVYTLCSVRLNNLIDLNVYILFVQ